MRDALNGLPWWIKAIGLVGFPIVVALFFMAQSAGYIRSVPSENQALLKELVGLTQDSQELIVEMRNYSVQADHRMARALQVLCENSAQTLAERNNCRNIQ